MGATSGAGTAYHSGAPAFTSRFSGINVTRSLALCICFVDRCLSLFDIVLSVSLQYLVKRYNLFGES